MWKKQLTLVTMLIMSLTVLTACQPNSLITSSRNLSSSSSNSTSGEGNATGSTGKIGANHSKAPVGTQSHGITSDSSDSASTLPITQAGSLSFSGLPAITTTSAKHAAAPDFLNANVGFIGVNDRVFMTNNGGQNWKQVGNFQGDVEYVTFINQDEGYVATRQGGNESTPNQTKVNYTWSLLRTIDGGLNWKTVWQASDTESNPSYMATNATVQLFGKRGYAILGHHLINTTDGQNWTSLTVQGLIQAAYAPTSENLWVLSSESPTGGSNAAAKSVVVLWHSTDGGRRFHQVQKTPDVHLWESKIAFTNVNDGVFLIKSLDTWQTTLYRTTDGGEDWVVTKPQAYDGRIVQGNPAVASDSAVYIPMDPGAAPFPSGVTELDLTTGKVITVSQPAGWRDALLSQSYDQTLYAAASVSQSGMSIYKSTDGGRTWIQVYPIGEPNISVRFVTANLGFGIGTDETNGYIYKTTDGGKSWKMLQSMRGVFPTAIAFMNNQTGYVSAYRANALYEAPNGFSLYVTHNGGKSWSTINPIEMPENLKNQIAQQTNLSASATGLSLFINAVNPVYMAFSSDGKTWREHAALSAPDGVAAAAFAGPNDTWIATSSSGTPQKSTPPVYNSTIYHRSQSAPSFQPLWSLPAGWAVLGMTRGGANNAYIYATKSLYNMSMGAAVFVTHNDGQSWAEYRSEKLSAPLPLDIYPSGAVIDLSFVNSQIGYMLTGNGLLKTTNGGSSWSYVASP